MKLERAKTMIGVLRHMSQPLIAVTSLVILALFTYSSTAVSAERPAFIALEGVDGGFVFGPLLERSNFGMGALVGDMNVRIAENVRDPGETLVTRRTVMSPVLGFGSCFVAPSNFHKFESLFAAEDLNLAGSSNLLGFTVGTQIIAKELDIEGGIEVACLLLFKEDESGLGSPVGDPAEANRFILRGFAGTPTGPTIHINMIGTVSFR